ncbi:unnamed protein product [Malus baccata var. baccata]
MVSHSRAVVRPNHGQYSLTLDSGSGCCTGNPLGFRFLDSKREGVSMERGLRYLGFGNGVECGYWVEEVGTCSAIWSDCSCIARLHMVKSLLMAVSVFTCSWMTEIADALNRVVAQMLLHLFTNTETQFRLRPFSQR